MAAADTPCEGWITTDDVAAGLTEPDNSPGSGTRTRERLLQEACDTATAWLYRLSGRRFTGTCRTTVLPLWGPCTSCGAGSGEGWVLFDSRYGTYTDGYVGVGGVTGVARRYGLNVWEVGLGYYPVREIEQVVIDGVPVDPSGYRLAEERWLQRLGQSWPTFQDLNLQPGSPGTWFVDLVYGTDVPPDGRFAARILAGELAKGATSGDCRLPKRATNLIRQGVNIALVDPRDMLDGGRFGIPEVDGFLMSVNPKQLAEGASIMNVDIPRGIRRVGTIPGS